MELFELLNLGALLLAVVAAVISFSKLFKKRRAYQKLYHLFDERLKFLKSKKIKGSDTSETLSPDSGINFEKISETYYDDMMLYITAYLDSLPKEDQELILEDLKQAKLKGRKKLILKLVKHGHLDENLWR